MVEEAGGVLDLGEWNISEIGAGRVEAGAEAARCVIPAVEDGRYHNAQISDYRMQGAGAFEFRWRPPLRMTVTAWASGPGDTLRGTAGFGFWTHPFSPEMRRLPRLPQAIWFFFASPPSRMELARGVPGRGWKAAQIDAARPALWPLLPLAPLAALAYRSRWLYDRLYPPLQRAMRIGERELDLALLAERHTYTIDWRTDGARFGVDGNTVLETPRAPRGPAGFVAWLDTQWAIVTPRGEVGFGLTAVEGEQALMIESIDIERK
jgi:hypothetical protein